MAEAFVTKLNKMQIKRSCKINTRQVLCRRHFREGAPLTAGARNS